MEQDSVGNMTVDVLLEVGAQCQRRYLWWAEAPAQGRDTPKEIVAHGQSTPE